MWEGVGDRTELQYIDPDSYGHQGCVFLILLMLNRRPGGPLCWLSLLHLITNWSGPQTRSGVPRAPSAGWWISLPHLVSNSSDFQLTDFLSPPSYIIVQTEITVMQFRGHSLPLHQSVSVPFRQPNPPTLFLSITGHWNVSLPSGASLWNGMFGRVEGQYTTNI